MSPFFQLERVELKEITYDQESLSSGGKAESAESHRDTPSRNNIPVSEFQDYVVKMTQTREDGTGLATEYSVCL